MKVSTSWLTQYLSKKLDTKSMAEALEASGIEVEQIVYAKKLDEHIIVSAIKKIVQHPNANKLQLATIFDGEVEIEVVCGAPNLKVGLLVPFAPVGTSLPDGTVIKAVQIRGQMSEGMLCSARELGLSDDHAGLLVLNEAAVPGTPLVALLALSDVIDVTTQANRFDLLSIVGLAREIGAQTGTATRAPQLRVMDGSGDTPAVEIEATTAVKRYMLARLRLESGAALPSEMIMSLEGAGLRSINPAVDVTNYEMLELGQPLHAFDAGKVKLPIIVRFAKSNEILTTLDGGKKTLTNKDLVIADQDGPIALAGVMGGRRSEVTADTREILVESAIFDATTVRKMAQRHGLRTDASARYERSLPSYLAEAGLGRALELYHENLHAELIGSIHDSRGTTAEITKISTRPEHISKVLSITVSANDLAKQLPKLGFEVAISAGGVVVTVPWWRPDVVLAEDLAEEYIRLIGYDSVPARLPQWHPQSVQADRYWPMLWQAKETLKGRGLFEVITYSFVSQAQLELFGYGPKGYLKLKNPLSIEQAYLRRNLLPSLYATVLRNQGYAGEFGIYETSQVFIPVGQKNQPKEPKQLGVLIKSQHGYRSVKAVLDSLQAAFNTTFTLTPTDQPEFLESRSAMIKHNDTEIGRIGQLHPRYTAELKIKATLGYLELDIETLFAASRPKTYQPLSRFPSIYRDLAVVVDEAVMWQDVEAAILATELAHPSFLNDYYDQSLGVGKKSLAMRLEMSSFVATLTDKEADRRLSKLLAVLKDRFSATQRT